MKTKAAMGAHTTSLEYGEIVSIAQSLRHEWRREHAEWMGSPFEWIKLCPERAQSIIGEKIVSSWLALHDFNIERSADSESNRVIEGKRVVVKFSTQGKDGDYVFHQIKDGQYDFVIFFGIAPDDAHCWIVPKFDLLRICRTGETPMSKAKTVTDACVHLNLERIMTDQDEAFSKYGNGLHDALVSISRLTGYTPDDLSETFQA